MFVRELFALGEKTCVDERERLDNPGKRGVGSLEMPGHEQKLGLNEPLLENLKLRGTREWKLRS